MWKEQINASLALEKIRAVRDQIFPNAGFMEQLVLFELCQYAPNTSNGVYSAWRTQLELYKLKASG